MRIELDAALKRVRRLEVYFETRAVFNDDEREAQRVAEQLGFDVEVLLLPVRKGRAGQLRFDKLRSIAQQLHLRRKWPASRIARALHCCGKTAERWISRSAAGL